MIVRHRLPPGVANLYRGPRRAAAHRGQLRVTPAQTKGSACRALVEDQPAGSLCDRSGPLHGRVTVNVEPTPGVLATVMVPPWVRMIDRAI